MSFSILLISLLTLVQLNCENLFDCRHDTLKNDYDFLPEAPRRWTKGRYWHKVNNIAKEIIACGDDSTGWALPGIVALCEVENDSVLADLTRRSLLRNAGYSYFMTGSHDERGIDVALLYSRFCLAPINSYSIKVPYADHRLRDILYVSGRIITGDTLHIFVCHAPSRYGGEKVSRNRRMVFAKRLVESVDSVRRLSPDALILATGDFNDYSNDAAPRHIVSCGMVNATIGATGGNGAKGTYKYAGRWGSLDHIFVSKSLYRYVAGSKILDKPFLLEDDKKYGGKKPFRTYNGYRFRRHAFSDHLPLILRFNFNP